MKRLLTIIMLLLAVGFQAAAQVDYSFGNIKKKRDKSYVPIAGFKGGLSMYNYSFSYKNYANLPGKALIAPGYGLFFEYPLRSIKHSTLGFEIMLIEKGYIKEFDARPNGVNIPKIEQINAKYVDFRIPFSYLFLTKKMINPYVFAAADVSYCYGGTQKHEFPENKEEYPEQSVDLSATDAVVKPIDISVLVGAGLRFNIRVDRSIFVVKLDGAYNLGLLNIKSSNKDVTYTNVNAWSLEEKGSWHNKGLELMISLGIPLKYDRRQDSCKKWH